MTRITKIIPPRNPDLDLQDDIICRLRSQPDTPLADVPPRLADAIRAIASIEFGGRCSFLRLLYSAATLPEFAWWSSARFRAHAHDAPDTLLILDTVAIEQADMPGEDRTLYQGTAPVVDDAYHVPLMVAEAIRQSPEWDVLVIPPTEYSSQRLVFQKRHQHSQHDRTD